MRIRKTVFLGKPEKMEERMRLQGRMAIVTGGAQGIGKVVSQKLAREGANVVIADIQEEPLREAADGIRKIGRKCLGIKTDVAEEKDVIAIVEKTLTHFGRIDILINNAGGRINTPPSLEETTQEQWNRVIAVNLTGTFLCCKAVLSHIKKTGAGRL